MKKTIVVLLSVLLMFVNNIIVYGENEENFGKGYIPYSMTELKIIDTDIEVKPEQHNQKNSFKLFSVELPTSFDSEFVSPVKAQSGGETCWAFAAIGAAESYMLKNYPVYDENNNLVKDTYDFSENNLQYMASDRNNNSIGYDTGIGSKSGGNIAMSSTYFMNRRGPVKESDDVYDYSVTNRDYSISANKPMSDYVVTDIAKLPDYDYDILSNCDSSQRQEAISDEKRMIMKYGSAVCGINSAHGFIDENKKYCYLPISEIDPSDPFPTDHSVLAVGWDDNYPKENFELSDGSVPPGDGAFKVKNSWGERAGFDGYFYLSYYDYYACNSVWTVSGMKQRNSNELLYSYDDYFPVWSITFKSSNDEPIGAVVFGNQFEKKTNNEVLKGISFFAQMNCTYDFYLVEDELEKCTDSSMIRFSDIESTKTKLLTDFAPEYEGYVTVNVDDVPINSDKFSVMVIKGAIYSGDGANIPIEANNADNKILNASSDSMQSFCYVYDNYWEFYDVHDECGGNVPVKAITASEDKYSDVSFVNYTDDDEAEKTEFSQGDTVNIAAVTDGVNLEGTTLVCAVYNDGKLIKVLDKTVGNKNNIFKYENIPDDFASFDVKVFALDSFNNVKPLGNVCEK